MKMVWLVIAIVGFPHLIYGTTLSHEDAEIFKKTKSRLNSQPDSLFRTIRRAGKKTIELEAFVSAEAEWSLVSKILGDYSSWSSWVLKGINERPSGGKYYMQILNVSVDPADKSHLLVSFLLNLMGQGYHVDRIFKMRARTEPEVFTLAGESLPNEKSLVERAQGFLKAFRADNDPSRVWIYIKGFAALRPWLVYEALPDRLMDRETGDRMRKIIDNYLNEERQQGQTLSKKRLGASDDQMESNPHKNIGR